MPFAVPVKINWARTPNGLVFCVLQPGDLTRIRWMSMFIPPSTKCVFINPGWCTTSFPSRVLSCSLQTADGKRRRRWRRLRQRRGMSRKTVSPPGANYLLYPPRPTAARGLITARYSGGASGGNAASVRRWLLPQRAASYQKQQGEAYRALYRRRRRAPRAGRLRLRFDGHSQSFGRVPMIVGGDCALLEHHATSSSSCRCRLRSVTRQAQLHRVKVRFARSRC